MGAVPILFLLGNYGVFLHISKVVFYSASLQRLVEFDFLP